MDINTITTIIKIITSLIPIGFLIKRNNEHATLIKGFKLMLPQETDKAKELMGVEKNSIFMRSQTIQSGITVINTKIPKPTIPQNEIDKFFNGLDDLNKKKFVIFKQHYIELTNNLKRFRDCKVEKGGFDFIMIDKILSTCKINFFDILWFKLAIKGRIIKIKSIFFDVK